MSRFRAAAIHLSICLAVAILLFGLFWFVWYPYPLAGAMGGCHIFMVLVVVDVVLGPLLTLIVFDTRKRSLRFDLAAIAFVQLVALAYGVWTLYGGRPVYIAALGHRFDVVQANEVDTASLEKSKSRLPMFGPTWVGTRSPDTQAERETIMLGGADLGSFPALHVPIEQMRAEMVARGKFVSEFKTFHPEFAGAMDQWLAKRGRSESNSRYQLLMTRSQNMVVVFDARDATVVGIAPFTVFR